MNEKNEKLICSDIKLWKTPTLAQLMQSMPQTFSAKWDTYHDCTEW